MSDADWSWVLGMDLAQKRDFTGLCALRMRRDDDGAFFELHAVERLPMRMPYPQQVQYVAQKVRQNPPLAGADLAVDQTGVGIAVVDMFRAANLPLNVRAVQITGGSAVTRNEEGDYWNVPKKELVGVTLKLVETHRLRMVPGLPYAETLKAELQAFNAKITAAGNETFGAWRERDHDDLVLAVALGVWVGERFGGSATLAASAQVDPERGRSMVDQAPPGVFFS